MHTGCSLRVVRAALAAAFALAVTAMAAGQATDQGFAPAFKIFSGVCSACHDWANSYEGITDPSRITPGSPEKSLLYQRIVKDEMPMTDTKLTAVEKESIRSWIAAGAKPLDNAGSAPAADSPKVPSASFLGFPDKVSFHKFSGWTSSSLLLAAGIVGVVHFVTLMDEGHTYRDSIGFTEGSPDSIRSAEISALWASRMQQALRWTHVGLLATGETLYLANAVTGVSMITRDAPGLTKSDIHRYAFFTHATLMAGQVILGFMSTDALARGNHDMVIGLGAAHAAIGLTIPLVMIGAGLAVTLMP